LSQPTVNNSGGSSPLARCGKMADSSHTPLDNVAAEYSTYEDFLDSQISATDLYYLEDEDLARRLVAEGYRGSGEQVKRVEFEAKKKAMEDARQSKRAPPKKLASIGLDLSGSVFLQELAKREEPNRDGRMTSIIFIRHKNARGQEISGYVDYAHRLKTDSNIEAFFKGEKLLLPRPSDLSFYNWETQASRSTSTPNYDVITDKYPGLIFKNKRDRKAINVDPKAAIGDNTTRVICRCPEYLQVVFYDHETRRKA